MATSMPSILRLELLSATCCGQAERRWKLAACGVSTSETALPPAQRTHSSSRQDLTANRTVCLEASLCPANSPLSHLKASLKMAGLFLFPSALPAERPSIKKRYLT